MADKGNQTKSEILRAACLLFCEKGYAGVTMSDICEATGLSRGGLYRHFSSTEEVFTAMLTADKDDWQTEMDRAIKAGIPAHSMLAYFLDQVRESIQNDGGRLSLAIYEFERSGQAKHDFIKKRYSQAVEMMELVLRYGQSRGEFAQFDITTKAEHIVVFLDGLKMAAMAIPLSLETVNRQLDTLLQDILKKETDQ